jgi:hypothetical protein
MQITAIAGIIAGTLQLTTSGERAALHAERIERAIGALAAALAAACDRWLFGRDSIAATARRKQRATRERHAIGLEQRRHQA